MGCFIPSPPRSKNMVKGGICVFPNEQLLRCPLLVFAVGTQLQKRGAVRWGSLTLPTPLLGSARNAHVDPLCVPFVEELRQRGLHEWLSSLSFDNPDCPDLQLTMGAVIVEEMRVAVEAATGFRCSAGISHNKVHAYVTHQPDFFWVAESACAVDTLLCSLPSLP